MQLLYRLHTCGCFLRFDMETSNVSSILTAARHILHCTITLKLFWFLLRKCSLNFQHWNVFLCSDMVASVRQVVKLWAVMWTDLIGRCGGLRIQTGELIKSIRISSNFINVLMLGSRLAALLQLCESPSWPTKISDMSEIHPIVWEQIISPCSPLYTARQMTSNKAKIGPNSTMSCTAQ